MLPDAEIIKTDGYNVNVLIGGDDKEASTWESALKAMEGERDARLYHIHPAGRFRFPQLLRLFGVYASASTAARAGWDKDIPIGQSTWSAIGKPPNGRAFRIVNLLSGGIA